MRAAQDEARKKMSDFAKEGRQQLREIERDMKDPRERARERERERERSVQSVLSLLLPLAWATRSLYSVSQRKD